MVGVYGETALLTGELILTLAIFLIDVVASVTFAATIARVNRVVRYSVQPRLVFEKVSQLSEPPIMQSCSLASFSRDSLADVRQILDGYSAALCLRLLNKSLANKVIRVPLKITLSARELFEFTLCRARTLLLQVAPSVRVASASLINLLSAKWLSIAISCDVNYSQVNAEHVLSIIKQRLIHIAHGVEVKAALAVNQIRLAFAERQHFPLIVATHERNNLTTFQRPDGHSLVFLERENSIVICDAAVLTKDALCFSIKFVGVGNLRNQSHDNLSRKLKGVADRVVDEFMQVVLAKCLTVPSLLADYIARLIRTLKRRAQEFGLLCSWLQLEIHNQFHAAIIMQAFKYERLRRWLESTISAAAYSSAK